MCWVSAPVHSSAGLVVHCQYCGHGCTNQENSCLGPLSVPHTPKQKRELGTSAVLCEHFFGTSLCQQYHHAILLQSAFLYSTFTPQRGTSRGTLDTHPALSTYQCPPPLNPRDSHTALQAGLFEDWDVSRRGRAFEEPRPHLKKKLKLVAPVCESQGLNLRPLPVRGAALPRHNGHMTMHINSGICQASHHGAQHSWIVFFTLPW